MSSVSRMWRFSNEWIEHATAFAKTLKGRELTPVERKIADEHEDWWDYFMIFGIQPETQRYIDRTIAFLEEADPKDKAMLMTYAVRLEWSAIEVLRDKHYYEKRRQKDNGSM